MTSALPEHVTGDRGALEAVSRRLCQTARLGDDVVLCRVLGKYIVFADPADVGITPHLCLDGFWESWVTIAIGRAVAPGAHCVDVGANHGYYTLIMADAAGPEGRVLAIEPNPRLVPLLQRTLEVNGFNSRAEVIQRAATDGSAPATTALVVPRGRGLTATLCRQPTASDDVVEVETISVDAATQGWPRVDLVKIDAEGAEEAIWRGMRRTLAHNSDVTVVMEFCCARYAEPRAFVREITAAGFALRHIDFDGSVRDTTEDRLLTEHVTEDWMLFLRRGDAARLAPSGDVA